MKTCIPLAALATALCAAPALAQDAQIPPRLEQQLGAVFDVQVAAHAAPALARRDRALQDALARGVSARVQEALIPPVRLGAVIARRASATELGARDGLHRVLYAAK